MWSISLTLLQNDDKVKNDHILVIYNNRILTDIADWILFVQMGTCIAIMDFIELKKYCSICTNEYCKITSCFLSNDIKSDTNI